jgi:heat shock protein HslJ
MVKLFFIPAFCCLIFSACSVFNRQRKEPEKKAEALSSASLKGTWVLDYVLGPADMTELYPEKKPELVLSIVTGGAFEGSTGCNRIGGKITADGRKMTFTDPVALTRMMCPGEGESTFLSGLKRINHYALSAEGNELTCIQGDIVIMRFHKK